MPSNRSFSSLFSLLLLFCTFAWGQIEVPPDRGYIQGGAYHSVRFGFSFKIPEGWEGSTVDNVDLDVAVNAVAKDEASAAKLKAGSATNYRLLTVTKAGSRQSIRVLASDVLLFPSLKTPQDALDATEVALKTMTQVLPERLKEESVEINGRQVVTRWLRTRIGKTPVSQTITAFIDQNYVVSFVGTFDSEEAGLAFDVAKLLSFEAKPEVAAPKEVRTGPLNGSISGRQYKNVFFNLELTFPEDWEVQEPEVMKRLQAIAERMQGKSREEPDQSEAAVQYLVSAMPKQRGAVLIFFFQKLDGEEMPAPADYLKLMAAGMPGGSWLTEAKDVSIQGRKFGHGAYTQTLNNVFVTHVLYVTIEKPYILVWDVASAKAELRKVGQNVVETMIFPPKDSGQKSADVPTSELKK